MNLNISKLVFKSSYLFILGGLLVINSCKSENEEQETDRMEDVSNETENTDETASNNNTETTDENNVSVGDNSRNALDWPGTYAGTLPCSDCDGIETEISINDNLNFTYIVIYKGQNNDEPFNIKGKFEWDKSGSTISLIEPEGNSVLGRYKVGENVLIKLDSDGNMIEGSSADKYRLAKVQ